MTDRRSERQAEGGAPSLEADRFPCSGCGAELEYAPGTTELTCTYCGARTPIPRDISEIAEQDYLTQLKDLQDRAPVLDTRTFRCTSCGASTTPPAEVTAFHCPFCGNPIVGQEETSQLIAPQALLPFRLERSQARGQFRKWIAKLWFAPADLTKGALSDSRFTGVYIPYWTFDADCTSDYSGMRGDDYWETQHYTTTDAQGRTVHGTRQVRRTRWRPVSGRVFDRFDDLLVNASRSLPSRYADALEPWDLKQLVPFGEAYLSGFRAERYQIGLPDGFSSACELMDEGIRRSVRRDIGGDHQRISRLSVQRDNISFKHVLLPIWISAFRYKERIFRILVNARTGEVQGERPWSKGKIAALIAMIVVAIVALAVILRMSGG